MAKVKVQITMEDEILRDLDNYCDDKYMPRSIVISQAVLSMLNQAKIVEMMQEMNITLKVIAKNNEMDSESKRKLEEFEIFSKMLIGQ